jgi:hypothetical protein
MRIAFSRISPSTFLRGTPTLTTFRNWTQPIQIRRKSVHIEKGEASATKGRERPTSDQVIELTRQWADKVVLGLRLCPFARLDETRVVCAPEEVSDINRFISFLRDEVDLLHEQTEVLQKKRNTKNDYKLVLCWLIVMHHILLFNIIINIINI